MNWFLYDNGLRHERVLKMREPYLPFKNYLLVFVVFFNKNISSVILKKSLNFLDFLFDFSNNG